MDDSAPGIYFLRPAASRPSTQPPLAASQSRFEPPVLLDLQAPMKPCLAPMPDAPALRLPKGLACAPNKQPLKPQLGECRIFQSLAIRRYLPSAGASPDKRSVCAATSRGRGSCGNCGEPDQPGAGGIGITARQGHQCLGQGLCAHALTGHGAAGVQARGQTPENCAVKTAATRPSAATNKTPTATDRSVATSNP